MLGTVREHNDKQRARLDWPPDNLERDCESDNDDVMTEELCFFCKPKLLGTNDALLLSRLIPGQRRGGG